MKKILAFLILSAACFAQTVVTGSSSFAGGTVAGASTFSAAGVASTPGLTVSGAPYTAGTGTTNFPQFALWPSGATGPTTWSTAGTLLGINGASGFTGNAIDVHTNGGSGVFSVNYQGTVTSNSTIIGAAFSATSGSVRFLQLIGSGTVTSITSVTASTSTFLLMTNTAARTVTLPQAPTGGTLFCVKDAAGTASTANVTVSVATSGTIDGAASNVINSNWGTHCYINSSSGVYYVISN